MSKPPQTETALAVESSDLLAFSRVIQHPFREGETRNVYEFPVTRKIVIEADPAVPESEVLALAKRCHNKEIRLSIRGSGYTIKLSSANDQDHRLAAPYMLADVRLAISKANDKTEGPAA